MKSGAVDGLPSALVAARGQLSLIVKSGRVWVLLGACIAATVLLEGYRVQGHGGVVDLRVPWTPPVLLRLLPFLMMAAVAWALLVWRGESWGRRDYHWSLPVNQYANDLWRVAAGALSLMAVVAFCIALNFAFQKLHGADRIYVPPEFTGTGAGRIESRLGAVFYLNLFSAPLLVYAAASIFTVATRRPLEWIVGIIAGSAIFASVADVFHQHWMLYLSHHIVKSPLGLEVALMGGGLGALGRQMLDVAGVRLTFSAAVAEQTWIAATVLWFAIVGLLLHLAAKRRR